MSKPKVLVAVLSGIERAKWLNPGLALRLPAMAHSLRFDVTVTAILDRYPVDCARNTCIVRAREHKADVLLMVDNDQDFFRDPLELLDQGYRKDVIAFPSMQLGNEDDHARGDIFIMNCRGAVSEDGPFVEIERAGTGALAIHRRVWEQVPGPWFRTILGDDEATTLKTGEDFYFCDLVRQHGFQVWAHRGHGVRHFHNAEMASLSIAVNKAKQFQQAGNNAF
jgi:hypothetical protein